MGHRAGERKLPILASLTADRIAPVYIPSVSAQRNILLRKPTCFVSRITEIKKILEKDFKRMKPQVCQSFLQVLQSLFHFLGVLFLTLKTFFLLDSSLAQCSFAPLKSTLLSGRLFPGFCV